jgi:RHS repeat-associated protein
MENVISISDISPAQDYYPFGMLMPGRYTSDTGRHCVTINTIVMMPRNIRVNAGLADNAVSMAYSYTTGNPSPLPVHQLPKAASFGSEGLHLYHYNDPASHPESWVVAVHTSQIDSTVQYEIDLSDEPSGITAYMQLHMDTSQTDQLFEWDMEIEEDCEVQVRVRQYADSTTDEYYELVGWGDVNSGPQTLYVGVDKTAVLAGGYTVLEFMVNAAGLGNFATNQRLNIYTPFTHFNQLVPQNVVTKVCDDDGDYRFGFNGQEKDNEIKGIGNHLDFGERGYGTREARFPSPDPLARQFPGQSPYSFAGNNPIWNIDKKGLRKETYNITVNQQTGTTTVKITSSPGLLARSYTSMHSGIKTYDWYDYSEANVTLIGKDGSSSTQTFTHADKFRTNTFFQSEGYAQRKVGEKSFFGLSASKEGTLGAGGGVTLTTKNALFKGNDHNLNRNGRGEFVNMDDIGSAFGVSSAASGAKTGNIWESLKYMRDGVMGGYDAQGLAPIKLNGNDTSNCDVPGGCGNLHVTDPKGNTQIDVPVPQGKTKEDY